MYRLHAFGGLAVERDGAPLDRIGAHRKALALLALLATQGATSRERLMALLWPESDAERARGSLKQAVHLLRRQLDAPDLLLGTTELRLNQERIESDVQLFLRALAAGDAATAVGHYRGPFLDSVHLDGALEFERWADAERAELARRYADALEELARDAEARDDHAGAAARWQRLQAEDPLNSRVALRLMTALDASGDRAGALRHGRVHETLLREELGIGLDPAVAALAARVRSAGAAPLAAGESFTSSPQREPLAVPETETAPARLAERELASRGGDRSGEGSVQPPGAPPRSRRARSVQLALVALLTVAGVGATLVVASGRTASDLVEGTNAPLTADGVPSPVPEQASIAVLPFVDMSPEGDQEYFADGITEEILNALAQVPELRVPARTSSFYFKGKNLPVREIAHRLEVATVLEGSVRRAGDRVRITAQLIDARSDRHLWSHTFDRDLRDVFAVQSEIARTVADALQVRLAVGQSLASRRSPVNPVAHDLYLRGRFHWNRRSANDLENAIRFFEEATRVDQMRARVLRMDRR